MLQYNLTQRERQIVMRLLVLSEHSKEHFEAHVIDPSAAGPMAEQARLDFGREGSMDITKRDLRVLKDEGLIYFHWHLPDRGTGRLSSLAFEAVKSNFHAGESIDAAAERAAAALQLATDADEQAIALRLGKITMELVELTRQLIDADEARAAEHEGISIAQELKKAAPDETIITRKTKGFVSRLSLTFSGTADLAIKGAKIGEFGERLSAWLVALSVWTEWHAAQHAAPDPCA